MLFKASITKNEDIGQEGDIANDVLKIESNLIDKKSLEKNINLVDGIIFTFTSEKENDYENIIKLIIEIEEKKPKGKFFPKIILGDISGFQLLLAKEKRCAVSDIYFIKSETSSNINTAIQALIQMKILDINYQKFKLENKINEKQVNNLLSKLKTNTMKCYDCNKILKITLDQFSNSIYLICNECNLKEKLDIYDFSKLKKKIKCQFCDKEINESLVNYSLKKNFFICQECTKKIKYKDKIYHNSFNLICEIHNKLYYKFCNTCKKSICIECEISFHMNHNITILNGKEILSLISIKKNNLDIEKENFKQMKNNMDDCMKSLKEYFDKLILYKEKEINIKEQIIKECELLKYENTLIENVKNLQFTQNTIDYNNESSLVSKLNNILEYFNTPIKLEKTNFCIKENLKGPYDIIQPIESRKSIVGTDDPDNQIIDLVPLHNFMRKNYFAVGFSNGLLKIYNDDFENRVPIEIITAFEKSEELVYLSKSSEKELLLVSYSKIKKIKFSEDLRNHEVINSMEISDQLFKMALEINELNALLTANSYNHIIFYDFQKGQQISNITKYIDSKEKEILFFDLLPICKIIIKFINANDTVINDVTLIERCTLAIKNTNEPQNVYWKILEFEKKDNNIEIKKNYWFNDNINYLGKVNEEFILINDPQLNTLSLFDFYKYSTIFRISFNFILKPIIIFPLYKRDSIYDLLFLFENEYLMQFALNIKKKNINLISKIKINKSKTKNNTQEKEHQNEIMKIVKLTKKNFLLINEDKLIYNLKKSNK